MDLVTLISRVVLKRSDVSGKKPGTEDLEEGELCINTKDKALYSKDSEGSIVRLNPEPELNSSKIDNLEDILS